MIIKNRRIAARFILMTSLVCAVVLLVWPLLAQAGPELPPRNPPPSAPPPDGDDGKDNSDHTPIGAYIELQVRPAQTGLWNVVQWQDSSGNWHEVEGWQGSLEASGYQRWWVAAKDFNTGPFRWVVAQGAGSRPLATSILFNLPGQANETVRVEVSLGR